MRKNQESSWKRMIGDFREKEAKGRSGEVEEVKQIPREVRETVSSLETISIRGC